MGEEGKPQGVRIGGMRARGRKGGEGREERPVPPMMAMGTGSRQGVRQVSEVGEKACLCMWWGARPSCG